MHSFNPRFLLGYTYLSNDQIDEAERVLEEIIGFTERSGYEYLGTAAKALSGMVTLARGNLDEGVRIIRERMQAFKEGGKCYHYLTFDYLLGKIFLQIATRQRGLNFSMIRRNLSFLLRHAPMAARKAEDHFRRTISMAESLGAKGILGQACLDLGRLYQNRDQFEEARIYLERSIAVFRKCRADVFSQEALALLKGLPDG